MIKESGFVRTRSSILDVAGSRQNHVNVFSLQQAVRKHQYLCSLMQPVHLRLFLACRGQRWTCLSIITVHNSAQDLVRLVEAILVRSCCGCITTF